MSHRWLTLAAVVLAGCTQSPNVEIEHEQPQQISRDFGRLPSVLGGIRHSGEIVLHEGLPSEFWEPQLLEREMNGKKIIRLHNHPFYDERRALQVADAERFTALFSSKKSFNRHRGSKACGSYHPDYCVEWKTSAATTRALVSLECGEVKIFGPQSELHCDLSPEARQKLERWLNSYQKHRPATEPRG